MAQLYRLIVGYGRPTVVGAVLGLSFMFIYNDNNKNNNTVFI